MVAPEAKINKTNLCLLDTHISRKTSHTGKSVGGTVQHARTVDDSGLELGQSLSITDLALAERAFF